MKIEIRHAILEDIPRLGQIAVSGFASKIRFCFGKSFAKNAAIFADLFTLGFLPLEHTFVATADGYPVGFTTVKFECTSFSINSFFRIFRYRLGFIRAIKALLSLMWLLQDPWDSTTEVFWEMMAVDDAYRSMGIGTDLCRQTYAYSCTSGRKHITGFVVAGHRAINLYQRLGIKLDPPTYRLPWLANFLYGFRGYHKLIWPLQDADRSVDVQQTSA